MAQELPEGTVTVLFTDVEGSTGLTTRPGRRRRAGDSARPASSWCASRSSSTAARRSRPLGDGFMVAFASARRAVACAVGIQRALEDTTGGTLTRQVRCASA